MKNYRIRVLPFSTGNYWTLEYEHVAVKFFMTFKTWRRIYTTWVGAAVTMDQPILEKDIKVAIARAEELSMPGALEKFWKEQQDLFDKETLTRTRTVYVSEGKIDEQ